MVVAVQEFPVARVDLPDGLPGMNMSDPRGDVVPKIIYERTQKSERNHTGNGAYFTRRKCLPRAQPKVALAKNTGFYSHRDVLHS